MENLDCQNLNWTNRCSPTVNGVHDGFGEISTHIWKPDLYKLQKEAPRPKTVIPNHPINLTHHLVPQFQENEYHGSISNSQAIQLLKEEGQYLIRRNAEKNYDFFVLSLRFKDKVHNYKLFYKDESFYVKEKLFSNVFDLVAEGLVTLHIEDKAGLFINLMQAQSDYINSPYVTLTKTKPGKTQLLNNHQYEHVEKGHAFKVYTFKGLNWCEFCRHFLWGFVAQGVRCGDCGFSAHLKCSEKVPSDCCPDLKHIRGVFGVDLTKLVKAHQTTRPFIVDKCVEEIEKRGLDVQGLYRVSGFNEDIEALRSAFDKEGKDADISFSAIEDVNVITGTLKLYFRLLPVPLITYETHPALMKALQINPENEVVKAIQDALTLLPNAHYNTLKYLIKHLSKVVARREQTKMTALNMATVFSPTLMPPPDLNNGIPSITSEITVLEKIIIYHRNIFQES